MTATSLNLPHLPKYVKWFAEECDADIEVIALNSPQPTTDGWETGGAELADAVFEMWTYCESRGITFQAPGTFIPAHLRSRKSQADHCIDGNLFTEDVGSWPIYVSADGRRSLCLVHHNDHRVEVTESKQGDTVAKASKWHQEGDSEAPDCDSCIASQICGGPCTLERILWGGKLNDDRCGFMRTLTKRVLIEG